MNTFRSRGFSLIEVLLASTLLAAGMALAFLTLRSAGVATERAQALAAENERLRAVQAFMRRQINGALALPLEIDPATGEASLLQAERNELRFVAAMPGYLSRGGPHVQTFRLVPEKDGLRLEFEHQLLTVEGPIDAERKPEVLLRGISDGEFALRTFASDGSAGEWASTWDQRSQLPQQVRLRLRMQSERSRFPELIVPLRLAAAYGPPVAPLSGTGFDADGGGDANNGDGDAQ